VLDSPESSYWAAPPAFPNAAGWLVSTIDDFWPFVRLLLNGGTHDGRRILSEASARRMVTDQLAGAAPFLDDGTSWGLGLAVPAAGASPGAMPRGFGWDGGTGTTWRSDPRTGLSGILFTQRSMISPAPPQAFTDFWRTADDCLAG